MKNSYWQAIHETYIKLEALCGAAGGGISHTMGAEDIAGTEVLMAGDDEAIASIASDDLVAIRSDLRTQLDFLKATLSEQYSERDTYLILFPIVAQIDEIILTYYLNKAHSGWPALQKELFQIDNAGEVFYEILDDILLKPQTALFIFEVYYFCLNYGFRGRHQDNPVKVKTYMKNLSEKLEQEELVLAVGDGDANSLVEHKGSRLMGYLVSVGAIAAVYMVLLVAGRNLL